MKILVDSREQRPFHLIGESGKALPFEVVALPTGDYSLEGFADRVAVERKSMDDLVQCLGRSRARFERELIRAKELEAFAVVVEGSFSELSRGRYRSKMNPHTAVQSMTALMVKHGTPFIFAGSRERAEYMTLSVLRQFLKQEKSKAEKRGLEDAEAVTSSQDGEAKIMDENGAKITA